MKKLAIFLVLMMSVSGVFAFQKTGGSVRGKVVDYREKPLGQVTLKLSSPEDTGLNRTVLTDGKGKFNLSGIGFGEIHIELSKEGFQTKVAIYEQKGRNETLKITLLTAGEAISQSREERGAGLPNQEAVAAYDIAVPLYQEGKYANALDELQYAIELDANLGPAYKLATYCAYKTNEWELALEYARAFLKFDAQDKSILQIKSAAEKHVEEAEKEAQKAPGDDRYQEAVGALNVNDDKNAKLLLLQVLEENENHAMAYYQLGYILLRELAFEDAVKNFRQFLELAPGHELELEVKKLLETLVE